MDGGIFLVVHMRYLTRQTRLTEQFQKKLCFRVR
ncbi:BnaC07g15540D [Brassica napus]|uniref:BnaC07g15540D protein n=1 Tax=Brassica napus TaxID=3708 RepID=A0A078I5R5_BRANA|nr:BnaC07g15540D [Brassica napus]